MISEGYCPIFLAIIRVFTFLLLAGITGRRWRYSIVQWSHSALKYLHSLHFLLRTDWELQQDNNNTNIEYWIVKSENFIVNTPVLFSREIGIEIIALTFIKQSQEQHVTWMHVIIFIFPNSCVLNITNCKQTGGEGKSPGLLTNSQCQVGREVNQARIALV